MKEYREIDLNEEPCVFPDCGHFLTVSSMDGQMDMAAHYGLDQNGLPVAVLGASLPFSNDSLKIKVCPSCRGSLRNIARYGRMVRRAMLDESTKKFTIFINEQHIKLAGQLVMEQEKLQDAPAGTSPSTQPPGKGKGLAFQKPRLRNILQLEQLLGSTGRYTAIIKLWRSINGFSNKLQEEEQPFRRVADFVHHANRENRASKCDFRYEESVIQVKGCLLATSLLLQCEVAIFTDFLRIRGGGSAQKTTQLS